MTMSSDLTLVLDRMSSGGDPVVQAARERLRGQAVGVDRKRQSHETGAVVSIEHAIGILESRQRDMELEDEKPMRSRDSRVYARGYGASDTISLLFNVDGADPTEVIASLEALRGEQS